MIHAVTSSKGSVVVVAVAILLLLSLLALTYITVMEIEVSSNEAFQFGIKADMVVNWVISDACTLIQSTVRNVGIYEDSAGNPHAVWNGVDYDNSDYATDRTIATNGGPMNWAAVPHNWYSPPHADLRRYDFDCYNMFTTEWAYNDDGDVDGMGDPEINEDPIDSVDNDGDGKYDEDPSYRNFFGYISPEGNIFGEREKFLWWSYQAYDIDLLNIDGDFNPQTHRQARWRTFRNPDPTVSDTWDNIYARSAGLVISTQKMLYLGEYRGDYETRGGMGPDSAGHYRVLTNDENIRPYGYNLACYEADPGDKTHNGQERVDRDKLSLSPNCTGNVSISAGNILDNGMDADYWPDITAWHGGEGMMNINALIRMLSHLVNERAAVAIAKHRPYRTKQHILQAVDAEGATLTTTEYARLMANVTCHANYDPVTGFCPLNINKVRSPQSICPAWCVGPDPLLNATYDRDVTNYLPNGSYKYRYKMITFQEYIDDDAPIPTKKKVGDEDDLSIWDIKRIWQGGADSDYYDVAYWGVIYPGGVDHGDFDPAAGSYFTSNANGIRVTNRLLWGAFSCIPSLVITSATTDSPHLPMHYDGYWAQMAAYAEREYNQTISHAPTMRSGWIAGNFTSADVLQTVIGVIQSATGGKLKHVWGSAYQMGSGTRAWINDVHPANMVFQSYAPGMGRVIPNSMGSGIDHPGIQGNIVGDSGPNYQWYWGWSPVQQGSDKFLSECYHDDGTLTGNDSGAQAMSSIWRGEQGAFIEDMDRFEEIIAWMAPFHPVANPHGRSIITERQANDILNNFIDFRDNVKDPNNLLTDWKLHSQEYDRGNYEAYKAGDIAKDGYLDETRLNTVCSMGNYDTSGGDVEFDDAGEDQLDGVILAKVPYLYIREPYFNADAYDRNPDLDEEGDKYIDEGDYTQAGLEYFQNSGLSWTDRLGLAKGDSIIEMNWNVSSADAASAAINIASLKGYGDPQIITRLENHRDNLYPWVNELEHQEYNILGIEKGTAAIESTYKNVSWIRNHGFASLNWTKDWVAFNYHRNHHKRDEFRRVLYGNQTPSSQGAYRENADFIAEGYSVHKPSGVSGTDWFDNSAADFDVDNDGGNNLTTTPIDDYGNLETATRYYYYESPGLVSGPDRIPDAYQTLAKGHELVDLSKYYRVECREHVEHHSEDANGDGFDPLTEDTYIVNGVCDEWDTYSYTYHYCETLSPKAHRRFADLGDTSDNDWVPGQGAIENNCFSNSKICDYDYAFRYFLYNCTDTKGTNLVDNSVQPDEYIYGYEYSDPENTDCSFMDADCKTMTFVGYRGSEVIQNHRDKHINNSGWDNGNFTSMGRFDLKTDSPYFHGASVCARKTKASSLATFSTLITLYNKPYMYDVPMKSPAASAAGGVTFVYSYNYGRNIYAYDFDGNAIALKTNNDEICNSMYYPYYKNNHSTGAGGAVPVNAIHYQRKQYGEHGCVAGSAGRIAMGGKTGYNLPTAAAASTGQIKDIVPRFNPVEPFFDPMYPNGRLFYRRLMTCGDTTIVLNDNYKNGPDTLNHTYQTVDGYDPMDFSTYTANNIYATVERCNVNNEDDTAKNPFILDGGANGTGVNTETWPVAGGNDAANTGHWNHVYHYKYSIPSGGPAALSPCADSAWSLPLTTRDRFYEIHVRAEIVNTSLSELGMYRGVSDDDSYEGKWMGWRGHEVLASKQAVAIFDRGWRWAYWDENFSGSDQACPYYDPFRMVGSRPGVDTACNGSGDYMAATSNLMIKDNEMCTYSDWDEGTCRFDRTDDVDQVPVGYIAPAEYSGVNRPGDDCAERARIVFFRWTGITQ